MLLLPVLLFLPSVLPFLPALPLVRNRQKPKPSKSIPEIMPTIFYSLNNPPLCFFILFHTSTFLPKILPKPTKIKKQGGFKFPPCFLFNMVRILLPDILFQEAHPQPSLFFLR